MILVWLRSGQTTSVSISMSRPSWLVVILERKLLAAWRACSDLLMADQASTFVRVEACMAAVSGEIESVWASEARVRDTVRKAASRRHFFMLETNSGQRIQPHHTTGGARSLR